MSSPLPPALDRPLRPPAATNLLLAGFAAVEIYDQLSHGELSGQGILLPAAVWGGEWEQWTRLLGAMFLHGGALHFVVDVLVLLLLGSAAERVYGRTRVVVAFLLSGLVAGLTTIVLRPDDLAVTASGATAGLAGLLAGLITFRTGSLPEAIENRVKVWVAGMIVVFSGLGFLVETANVTMHLGGFLTGLLLATGFETEVPSVPRPALGRVAAGLLIGAGVTLGFVPAAVQAERTLVGVTIRSESLHEMGRSHDAIALLETALGAPIEGSADRKILPIAQNDLAWYYVEAGRNLDRALDVSLESNNRMKDQPDLLDTLGYLYALSGRCREASDAMGRAVRLDPSLEARRVEVERACAAGQRPDTKIERALPTPTPTPLPKGEIGA